MTKILRNQVIEEFAASRLAEFEAKVGKKLTVQAHKFSGKAAEKIAAAGGTAEVLGAPAAQA